MRIKNLVLAILSIAVLSSCSSSSEAEVNGTSQVQFKLVDAPGDYKEVNVEIVDIQYNNSESEDDSAWKSFTSFSGPINVDLTTLIAGNSVILSDEVIEAGMLKQIRLVLGSNNTLLLEGEINTRPLSTPSAQQSGLKLMLNEELEAGFSYTFILDWDVQKSIVEAGGSGNYNLKPVIRVNAEKNSGTISGSVFQDNGTTETSDDTPLEDALVSIYTTTNVLVAETYTNAEGNFTVQGLPAGNYIVKITKGSFIEFTSSTNVTVNVGETVSFGNVVLISI
ncbi:DUF4382 domain-containing protein [Polaribacter aestuariivivens]|uniref:DUF4382 domain-containing protein n=1 Tax=Polaribacter aestuariivivens TaxID=2304626 RepID=A0A5S3N2W7_9FLAO|nr:DUF4382 domain-containing protein [Polaribacter aestuariivivens]TMM28784.1 DUF4382 domain-containing protein [Polaribacter aestuariivivens]